MATTIEQHIANGGGICGTCARPAEATPGNEGYSDCCNDRIEYGSEASDTVRCESCEHEHYTEHERRGYNQRGDEVWAGDVTCDACGMILN